jgi:hypothetical protein
MGLKNYPGQVFDYWTLISRAENFNTVTRWLCRCKCGTEKIVRALYLNGGRSKSCGRKPPVITSHGACVGGTFSKKYKTWRYIRQRCLNPNHQDAKIYNGLLCERWLDYKNFAADVLDPESDDLSIDRIKNDKGYEPGNVRWVTMAEQHRNQSNCRWIEYEGRTQLLTDWAKELNLTDGCLRTRIEKHGVDIAFKADYGQRITPAHNKLSITINETTDSVVGWANRLNVHYDTIKKWRKNGKLEEKVMSLA